MLNAKSRHPLLGRIVWNPTGTSLAQRFIRLSRKVDMAERNDVPARAYGL